MKEITDIAAKEAAGEDVTEDIEKAKQNVEETNVETETTNQSESV